MGTMQVGLPLQLPCLSSSTSSVVVDCYIWWCWFVQQIDNDGLIY